MLLCCVTQKVEDGSSAEVQTAGKANEVQTVNHSDTTSQQASTDKPSEQRSERELCQWVMAKANSLNEVNSRNLDVAADLAYARISLDAESGPAASRRRRKRYSPSRSSAQKVS